jgi:hypothetical protein
MAFEKVRIEVSGFYGSEPGENRWIIQQGPLNSWAARAWYFPSKRWAAQVSVGRLAHPEALEPGDQLRTIASIAYSRPEGEQSWDSSLIWGRVHHIPSGENGNSFLFETAKPLGRINFVTARVELADKSELFPAHTGPNARIGAYTAGFTHDLISRWFLETGVGANFTFYTLPESIQSAYGNRPVGGNVYLRIRIRPAAP